MIDFDAEIAGQAGELLGSVGRRRSRFSTRDGRSRGGLRKIGHGVLDVFLCCAILWCAMEVLLTISKGWVVIAGAPVQFIGSVISLGTIAYLASRWRYKATIDGHKAAIDGHKSTIEHLTERLRGKDDQLSDLKEKVGTDSPSEIKMRIDGLEVQLARLAPRRLSEDVINRIVDSLRVSPGAVSIANDSAVADAQALAVDLARAFSNAGWAVERPFVLGISRPPPTGIGVLIAEPSSPTPKQGVIIDALRNVGIAFDLQRDSQKHPMSSLVVGGAPFDAEIMISQRLS